MKEKSCNTVGNLAEIPGESDGLKKELSRSKAGKWSCAKYFFAHLEEGIFEE